MILQTNEQTRIWSGAFGREYSDRNTFSPLELDALYRRNYGMTRTEVNRRFLQSVPTDARILEVGCNLGNQLLLLQAMGFTNLYGIEIQHYALERARQRLSMVKLSQASALAIPYSDREFDLVFTSGVLIHIPPANLPLAMSEIHRCAKQWIWGFEYYAPEITAVMYRGHEGLLWKGDYATTYIRQFPQLELKREERMPYVENSNIDTAFLLCRQAREN